MKRTVRFLGMVLVFAILITCFPIQTQAASKIKLNKKKVTLTVGDSVKLKVSGTRSSVKWSSSKKSVAIVSKKGIVKAKSEGVTTITAKVSGKKLICKVIVEELEEDEDDYNYDDEDFDEDDYVEPTPVVEETLTPYQVRRKLADLITSKGSYNDEGNKEIESTSGYGLNKTILTWEYEKSENRIVMSYFMMTDVGNGAIAGDVFLYLPLDGYTCDLSAVWLYRDANNKLQGMDSDSAGTVSLSSVRGDYNSFTWTSKGAVGLFKDSSWDPSEQCNGLLDLLYSMTEIEFYIQGFDYKLTDMGFGA